MRGSSPRAATLALALLVLTSVANAQELPPPLTQTVNDFANVIAPGAEAQLDDLIRRLKAATGDVVVVATVQTFQPWADLPSYANKMFENHGRGIGDKGKDNGALIVLAIDDRQVRIEVGYDLESIITDGYAGETSRQTMVPLFRNGDYGGGLLAGTTRIIRRIAEVKNVALEGLPAAREEPVVDGGGIPFIFWIILAVILLNMLSGGGGGRGRRSRWSSRVGPFGAGYGGWSIGHGHRGGGWSSGGGGFGGGFGGFGGGSSGGGGGGGSW